MSILKELMEDLKPTPKYKLYRLDEKDGISTDAIKKVSGQFDLAMKQMKADKANFKDDPDQLKTINRDVDDYKYIKYMIQQGHLDAAKKAFRDLDTAARDALFDVGNKAGRKITAKVLDVDLLHESALFIMDMGKSHTAKEEKSGKKIEIKRYAVYGDDRTGKPEVIDQCNDLEHLKKKHGDLPVKKG